MMNNEAQVAERFPEDVEDHVIHILKDTDVYRHLIVANPRTRTHHYEIVTFPGYLVYVGDMGAYTFSRTNDMFQFFRNEDGKIRKAYWAEKVTAQGRHEPVVEFDPDVFTDYVVVTVTENLAGAPMPDDVAEALDDLKRYVGCKEEAVLWLDRFHGEYPDLIDPTTCPWGWYSYHFLWACHAIVHAIKLYDGNKTFLRRFSIAGLDEDEEDDDDLPVESHIYGIHSYRDGGTVRIEMTGVLCFLDRRTNSPTLGKLLDRYPSVPGANVLDKEQRMRVASVLRTHGESELAEEIEQI